MTTLPTLPPGGLTSAHRARFVNEAGRAHMDAIYSNGKEALERHSLAQAIRRAFVDLWDAYNNEDAPLDLSKGSITGEFVRPLSWLSYDRFTPKETYYSADSIEQIIPRVEQYGAQFLESCFLWDLTWGVVGVVESGGKPTRYALIQTPFFPEHSAEMRGKTEKELEAFYKGQTEMKIHFPIPYEYKKKGSHTLRGTLVLEIGFALLRFQEHQEYRLSSWASLSLDSPQIVTGDVKGPPRLPLELWNLADECTKKFLDECKLSINVDWAACLNAALLEETAEPADPNQLEMPLETSGQISITDVLNFFPVPSTIAGRLSFQAWGSHVPKERRELDRIMNKPKEQRTATEIQRTKEIRKEIIINQNPHFGDSDDPFKKTGVELTLMLRDARDFKAEARVQVFAESSEGEVTDDHIDGALDSFWRYFVPTFHGQGRRHVMLILKELVQNNWAPYKFEAAKHIGKMRDIKPGEVAGKAEKEEARRIVFNLCHTAVSVQSKTGKRHAAERQRFFNLEHTKDATNKRDDEVWTITATDGLKKIFRSDRDILFFVPVLDSIIKEDHQDHGIAAHLYLHLSTLWRMNPIRKLDVKTIFDLIGKDSTTENKNRRRDLEKLESELDYMTARTPPFLGSWAASGGDAPRPSKCKKTNPVECMLTLVEPDWLTAKLEGVRAGIPSLLPSLTKPEAMNRASLEEAIKASGLSANKFAEAVGLSKGHLSKMRAGTKEIAPFIQDKIRAQFGHP